MADLLEACSTQAPLRKVLLHPEVLISGYYLWIACQCWDEVAPCTSENCLDLIGELPGTWTRLDRHDLPGAAAG